MITHGSFCGFRESERNKSEMKLEITAFMFISGCNKATGHWRLLPYIINKHLVKTAVGTSPVLGHLACCRYLQNVRTPLVADQELFKAEICSLGGLDHLRHKGKCPETGLMTTTLQ